VRELQRKIEALLMEQPSIRTGCVIFADVEGGAVILSIAPEALLTEKHQRIDSAMGRLGVTIALHMPEHEDAYIELAKRLNLAILRARGQVH
jgi:hypothetical protein